MLMFRAFRPNVIRFLPAFIAFLIVFIAAPTFSKNTLKVGGKHRSVRKKSTAVSKLAASNNFIRNKSRNSTNKRVRKLKETAHASVKMISDTMLAEGARLINYRFGKQNHNVFVLEISLNSPDVKLEVVKSLDIAGGLERVIDMPRRLDSCCGKTIIAAVNANFWRAYRNLPIGPLVIDGEIAQMLPYKKWSSAFFDANGRMTIDRFTMSGALRFAKKSLPVVSANYRRDSLGICVYNRFSGAEIPSVAQKSVEQAFEELRLNSLMLGDDSTEIALDVEQMKNEIARAKLEADAEFKMIKAQARYLDKPAINKPIRCVIDTVKTGGISIPAHGCVLSFGCDADTANLPRTGEAITLQFSTEPFSNQQFEWAVSGSPRLVRNGVAKHEASAEGVTSKRFIGNNLARTAIGSNKERTKNIIVVVQANNDQGKGATLAQTSAIMKHAGAWNAMNLDGGGSTRMIADGRNVFNGDTASTGRRVAATLAIALKNRNGARTGSK